MLVNVGLVMFTYTPLNPTQFKVRGVSRIFNFSKCFGFMRNLFGCVCKEGGVLCVCILREPESGPFHIPV